MLDGVQIKAVLRASNLVGFLPSSRITNCIMGSSILLEDKIPLLMYCDICKPRMNPVGQNIGVFFLVYRTGFNNF
jgi:hypothetical protein